MKQLPRPHLILPLCLLTLIAGCEQEDDYIPPPDFALQACENVYLPVERHHLSIQSMDYYARMGEGTVVLRNMHSQYPIRRVEVCMAPYNTACWESEDIFVPPFSVEHIIARLPRDLTPTETPPFVVRAYTRQCV